MAKFGPKPKTVEDRFWPKVMVLGPWDCWPWLARCLDNGYGRFGSHGLAHRASYELAYGKIPTGHYIIHACDHPWCVNPAHLKPSPPAGNTADMVAKRRHTFGEAQVAGKLVSARVMELRRRFASGENRDDIAAAFGICRRSVYDIADLDTWKLLRTPDGIVEAEAHQG